MTRVGISRRAWMIGALAAGVGAPLAARAQQRHRLVFVGTYTGPKSRGIHAFRFDDTTGAFTPLGLAAETVNPSFLTASRDGRFLFAVNETGVFNGERTGSVTSFAVDPIAGRLTPISVQPTQGAAPCHLMLDQTERVLAVANYTGGNFVLLPVDAGGRIGPVRTSLHNSGAGPDHTRQQGPHAHMVLFDPANRFLLGADLGIDRVLVYRFDPSMPTFAAAHAAVELPAGSGPRHLAFHPTDPVLFGINELASTISLFAWDASTGTLERRGEESTLPYTYTDLNATAEIAVHPSGRFLYGSNRGHDSIAAWGLSSDGQLASIDYFPTLGRTPRHFTIDPTGRWLIAANQDSDTLATFEIDDLSGRLTPTDTLTACPSPVCVLFV